MLFFLVCTAHCKLHTIHCTLHPTPCAMYFVHLVLHTAQSTLQTLCTPTKHCVLYCALCSKCKVLCLLSYLLSWVLCLSKQGGVGQFQMGTLHSRFYTLNTLTYIMFFVTWLRFEQNKTLPKKHVNCDKKNFSSSHDYVEGDLAWCCSRRLVSTYQNIIILFWNE